MSKKNKFKKNPKTERVWNDLEQYKEFCREYGYVFDEKDLYNLRTYPFQQYNKFCNGKKCKNQWDNDNKKI